MIFVVIGSALKISQLVLMFNDKFIKLIDLQVKNHIAFITLVEYFYTFVKISDIDAFMYMCTIEIYGDWYTSLNEDCKPVLFETDYKKNVYQDLRKVIKQTYFFRIYSKFIIKDKTFLNGIQRYLTVLNSCFINLKVFCKNRHTYKGNHIAE